MKFFALTVALLLLPVNVEAYAVGSYTRSGVRERVEARRQRRLANQVQTQPIRIGRTIRTRAMSPRRTRYVHEGIVERVIDGSVFIIKLPSVRSVIRILGAEAPLIVRPESDVQCFAPESKRKLESLVLGRNVVLERDKSYQRDSHRRSLRYVRFENTRDVGAWMIQRGYAFSDRKNDHKRQTDYNRLELQAREDELGLWGPGCDYEDMPSVRFEVQ